MNFSACALTGVLQFHADRIRNEDVSEQLGTVLCSDLSQLPSVSSAP
jgi:hypothetical protein